MKAATLCSLALAGFLGLGSPALAVTCSLDYVPAATLVLPYFEVDLTNPNGLTTLFAINNSSSQAVLAHAEIWTDLSVPILGFNVYLTGYDIQTVNLRDLLVSGVLPATASTGQDPSDTISPKGALSQDINFASCNGALPPPPLSSTYITHLQNSLTGLASPILAPGAACAGRALGDHIARGYITIDTVNNCTLRFPGDVGYFASGGTGDATNQNVLLGDYFFVNQALNFAEGGPLIHLEASATNVQTSTAGEYTFYGRYLNPAWTAADNREPMATSFITRFLNGGAFSSGTSLVVWRDPKVDQASFACPALPRARPAWYPLGQEGIVAFDEQENPVELPSNPVSPQPTGTAVAPFPAAAQRVQVGGPALPVPFNFGALYLNLNTTVNAAGSNPPEDPAAAQAYVIAEYEQNGRYAVGFEAAKLDSACRASHVVP